MSTTNRASTAEMIERIVEMVADQHSLPISRNDLAIRWNVTTRNVHNILAAAETLLGVKIRYTDFGYMVIDTGVLDVAKCRKAVRRGRA